MPLRFTKNVTCEEKKRKEKMPGHAAVESLPWLFWASWRSPLDAGFNERPSAQIQNARLIGRGPTAQETALLAPGRKRRRFPGGVGAGGEAEGARGKLDWGVVPSRLGPYLDFPPAQGLPESSSLQLPPLPTGARHRRPPRRRRRSSSSSSASSSAAAATRISTGAPRVALLPSSRSGSGSVMLPGAEKPAAVPKEAAVGRTPRGSPFCWLQRSSAESTGLEAALLVAAAAAAAPSTSTAFGMLRGGANWGRLASPPTTSGRSRNSKQQTQPGAQRTRRSARMMSKSRLARTGFGVGRYISCSCCCCWMQEVVTCPASCPFLPR